MKKIIGLLLVVVFLPLPAYAAETEIFDYHEASIPIEFLKKQDSETGSEQKHPTSTLTETNTSHHYEMMPQTGAIIQMGLSFVGTFLMISTLLLIKRRYKNE